MGKNTELGLMFILKYPIFAAILVIGAIVTIGFNSYGLIVTVANPIFILLALIGIILVRMDRGILGTSAMLAFIYLFVNIVIQFSNVAAVCNLPFVGGLICGTAGIILLPINMFFIFLPAFIDLMLILYFYKLIEGHS